MTVEAPLDIIPNLLDSELNSTIRLFFDPTNGDTDFDNISTVQGAGTYAPDNPVYEVLAAEGEMYSILSITKSDPFLRVYDMTGKPIATNSEEFDAAYRPIMHDTLTSINILGISINVNEYEYDYIPSFKAPYTGKFFIKPGWDQQSGFEYFGLIVQEDIDTDIDNIDRIFDYGEATYPTLFPEHHRSEMIEPHGYYARFYSNGYALGEKEGGIYFYNGEDITLVGTASDFRPVLEETGLL